MLKSIKLVEAGGSEAQDRVEIIERSGIVVILVADGAGGRGGGAEASGMVIEMARKAADSLLRLDAAECVKLLAEMDRAIEADHAAGETTAVIAVVSEKEIVGASVGDSEAWLVTSRGYERITKGQVRKPMLGSGMAMPVSFRSAFLDGTLLVATDGLFKYTSAEKICAAVNEGDLDRTARALSDLVRLRSGHLPDDLGIALSAHYTEAHERVSHP